MFGGRDEPSDQIDDEEADTDERQRQTQEGDDLPLAAAPRIVVVDAQQPCGPD